MAFDYAENKRLPERIFGGKEHKKMKSRNELNVNDTIVRVIRQNGADYVCPEVIYRTLASLQEQWKTNQSS